MSDTDDITVPVIEITKGWTVDDIETEDDCDDAFAVLTGLVAAIELRIDEMAAIGETGAVAYRRAKAALRWKKAALQIVQTKRGKINRIKRAEVEASRDRRLLETIRAMSPDAFYRAVEALAVTEAPQ